MRWQGRRGSRNVEDRRRASPAKVGIGGGAALIIVLIILCMGGNPLPVLQQMQQAQQNAPQMAPPGEEDPAEERMKEFVSVVLGDTEDVWHEIFSQMGNPYREPRLVLYREQVRSACGFNSAATGPFYCPGDEQIYLDLSFFDDMARQLGAPGDFAQAYVIAHEVGHHVQKLLGISDQVRRQQQFGSEAQANEWSVRLELQADFLAGVWAHHAQENWQILEEGDVEEALRAATAIGDDRLQRQSRGYVVPESFTHGTSEQRVRWFARGLRSGRLSDGDQLFELDYDEL